uniref:ATP synthase complex subunit 8 n=1 Tax=Pseudagrion civicum TaxID=218368 RepID=Q85SC2_9ODON|nr:ATP synthase F0 subunit 8 [Pseudagrion civicum]
MPQMAPMSWLLLFLTFTTCLMMMNTINYYIYAPKLIKMTEEKKKMNKTMNWK